MHCDLCKKGKATVRVTQDPTPMPGEIIHIDLCSRCAHKYGLDDPSGFSLADLLRALGIKISTPIRRNLLLGRVVHVCSFYCQQPELLF